MYLFCYIYKHKMMPKLFSFIVLKGTATLIISMFYRKGFYAPWTLKQVSSKSVEKMGKLWAFKEFNMATF